MIFNCAELTDVVLSSIKKTKKDKKLKDIKLKELVESEPIPTLDYDTLDYGNITLPAVTNYDYQELEKQTSSKDETISTEEIEDVIKDQAISNMFGVSTSKITPEAKDRFGYWKLFNRALLRIKYDLAFT